MGRLLTFYIEHNFWFCGYPETFQKELFADRNHILAPATLNAGSGTATRVAGGYRLAGQWQWGTGILHADWVLAGALVREGDGPATPLFFALPREDVEGDRREAVQDICSVTGASGSRLESPVQRSLRDITAGSNHVIFDREMRYADYGRILLDQPIQNLLV